VRAAAFVAAILALMAVLYQCVPYGLYHLGIGSGYHVGTLRSGSAAYRQRLDLIPDALRKHSSTLRRRRAAWAFARGGEVFRIQAEASASVGAINLILDEFLGGGVDPVWRHRFESTEAVQDSVVVPGTGLYLLRFSWSDFVGEARFRWSMDGG
jgi:hypothetical protein